MGGSETRAHLDKRQWHVFFVESEGGRLSSCGGTWRAGGCAEGRKHKEAHEARVLSGVERRVRALNAAKNMLSVFVGASTLPNTLRSHFSLSSVARQRNTQQHKKTPQKPLHLQNVVLAPLRSVVCGWRPAPPLASRRPRAFAPPPPTVAHRRRRRRCHRRRRRPPHQPPRPCVLMCVSCAGCEVWVV